MTTSLFVICKRKKTQMNWTQETFAPPEIPKHSVVDLGYLVYYFVDRQDYWQSMQWMYSAANGCILADEGTHEYNARKDAYRLYKDNRKDYKNQELHKRARRFWQEIKANDMFDIRSIYGLEGDDVCALLALQNGYKIVSQDKDFLQLRDVRVEQLDCSPTLIRQDKLPKTLQHIEFGYREWLLYLTIDGDTADNIPQLRSKGRKGLEELGMILEAKDSWGMAEKIYGPTLLSRNLELVLLPHPNVISIAFELSHIHVLDLVASDDYIKYVKKYGKWCM